MRLWHKNLIEFLPKQQLLSQWRELVAIKGSIIKNGTPNHILVNKVMDYDMIHLLSYGFLIKKEFIKRGYNMKDSIWNEFRVWCLENSSRDKLIEFDEIYKEWHNDRYLRQCFHNLQEKYDCGGLTREEWSRVLDLGI